MSAFTEVEVERIRTKAKALGIKHWHLKKPENLQEEIQSMETFSNKDKIPKISFGQIMDYLDQMAIDKMTEAFNALDQLKEKRAGALAVEMESKLLTLPENGSISIDALKKWCEIRLSFSFTHEFFIRVLDCLSTIYSSHGWYYDEDEVYALEKPYFNLSWHLCRWKEVNNSKEKQLAHRLFSILLQPEEGSEVA